jgi:hypothetical protein
MGNSVCVNYDIGSMIKLSLFIKLLNLNFAVA